MTDRELLRVFDLARDARERVLAEIRRAIAPLDRVVVAFAFGSFVRGERFRDLDIAVLFDEPMTFRDPGRVAGAVEAAVADAGPAFPVDVIPLNDAAPGFRCRVADEGIVLHERDPGAAVELWVRARSQVLDLAEWHRLHGVATDGAP